MAKGKAKHVRIVFGNRMTKWGWDVKTVEDLVLALEGETKFSSVAECFIVEAVYSALRDKQEWKNITEFSEYVSENYI